MRLFCYLTSVTVLLLAGTSSLRAQDMRHVEEPHLPSACVVLHARLAAAHGVLAADAERDLDTDRIQQAMDHCVAGEAVVLQADGSKQTFLSGPLTLRSGVILVID